MKILERTTDRLRVCLRWPAMLAVLFCGMWGVAAFVVFRSEHIQGERSEDGTVNLRISSRFFGLPVSHRRFYEVSEARMEVYHSVSTSEGTLTTNILFRVMLDTPQGSVPFSGQSSIEREHWTTLATVLDGFIQDPERSSFRYVHSPGWVGWLLLGVFVFVVVLFRFQQGGELLLDKANDEAILTGSGIPKPRSQRFRLTEVQGFYMVANPRHSISVGQYTSGHDNSHYLVMRLASGKQVSLGSFWSADRCHSLMSTLERFRADVRPPTFPKANPERETRTFTVPLAGVELKVCVICGSDCSTEPRYRDDHGHYYHERCYAPTNGLISV
jgi:hypothetical protein